MSMVRTVSGLNRGGAGGLYWDNSAPMIFSETGPLLLSFDQ